MGIEYEKELYSRIEGLRSELEAEYEKVKKAEAELERIRAINEQHCKDFNTLLVLESNAREAALREAAALMKDTFRLTPEVGSELEARLLSLIPKDKNK